MRIAEGILLDAAKEILVLLGEENGSAQIAAEALVSADMRGISSHGVNLLRLISQRVSAKMLNIPTRIEIIRNDTTTAVLNGNNGLGQVAAHRGMHLSIEKAKCNGIGMVSLRNTNNIGALGHFTSSAAVRDGVVSIIMTNGNPSVAPFGSADPFLGTNPLSIAVPALEGRPLVLDMSSSVVARGKIRLASMSGESIPLGWALDETGEPTCDPKRALKGSLLPLGGPKGSGLAMMIDILAGMLSGSAYGRKLKSFHELDGATGVGACFITIDISRFVNPESFVEMMEIYLQEIKGLRRQAGVAEIFLPGEIELQKVEESRRAGIEIPETVARSTDEILAKLGSSLRIAVSREKESRE
jgi:LDH2 family malate/lactate/ureidoglycolate dehydrogenase